MPLPNTACVAFVLLLPGALMAQSSAPETLSVSPAVIELSGEPGQSTTQAIMIGNNTRNDVTFQPVANDVVVRDGKRVFVPAGEVAHSIAATMVFSPRRFVVPAGESRTVDVRVTVPAGVQHRSAVAIFDAPRNFATNTVAMVATVGVLLTFSLSKDIALSSTEINVRPPSSSRNAEFSQSVTNVGSEPVIAKGMIAILDAQQNIVGKIKLPPQRLLPHEQLPFKGEYSGDMRAGTYKVQSTIEFADQFIHKTYELRVP